MAAKRSVLLVLAMLAASFAGGATSHWLLVVRAVPRETPDPGPQPITTTHLTLVDEAGNTRAELRCADEDSSSSGLIIYYDDEHADQHTRIVLGSTWSGHGLSVSQRYYDTEEEAARVAEGDTRVRLDEISTTMHVGIDDFLPAVQMESGELSTELGIEKLAMATGMTKLELGLDVGGDYGLTILDAEDQQLVRLGTSEGDPELRLHDPDSDKTIHASVNRTQALLAFSQPGDAGAFLLLQNDVTLLELFGRNRPGGGRPSLSLYGGPSFGGPAIGLQGADGNSVLALDGLLVRSDTDMARLGIDQFGALIKLTDNGETVWSESAEKARRRTHEKLLRQDITLDTQGNSLADIFRFIGEFGNITIQPEWPALKASGVTPDIAVNVDVRDVSLPRLLRAVLDDVAGDEPLGYFIDDDGVVVITTQSEINKRPQ